MCCQSFTTQAGCLLVLFEFRVFLSEAVNRVAALLREAGGAVLVDIALHT